MQIPTVSVVIPMYNSDRFIKHTIESILAQTFQDFELLVFDDCSKDKSFEIAQSIQDPRLKVLQHEKNLGAEGNWNYCLQQARGKYIKLVCGDDTLTPDCLAKQVAVLEDSANSDVALVSCSRQVINSQGKNISKRSFPFGEGKFSGPFVTRNIIRRGTNMIGEPAVGLFRSNLVAKVGPYSANPAYTIDVDYWVRLLEHGQLFVIKEALATFRISANNWTRRLGTAQFTDFVLFTKKVKARNTIRISQLDLIQGKVLAFAQFLARNVYIRLFA